MLALLICDKTLYMYSSVTLSYYMYLYYEIFLVRLIHAFLPKILFSLFYYVNSTFFQF